MFDYIPPPPAVYASAPSSLDRQTAPGDRGWLVAEASARAAHHPHRHHNHQRFVLITGEVKRLLPDDDRGLRHQRFLVSARLRGRERLLEIDHDISYGRKVPDLSVGESLTIRGVLYHDRHKDGMHWTHHRVKSDDAGYIQTPDGRRYQ